MSLAQALKYMARYVYRVAISNDRFESLEDGQITFRYKDYARGGAWRSTTLSADEFLRRFLQHVVPPHFVRIRSFGFLASCHRERKLALIRRLLGVQASASASATPSDEDPDGEPVQATHCCPYCGHHVLRPVGSTTRPSDGEGATMAKLTVQVRTHDSLLDLLANGESPAWVIAGDRVPRITNVQVVNWDGTQMIEKSFDPESPRRDDGRLVLRFFDAHIVNCRVTFDGQNPVRYIDG